MAMLAQSTFAGRALRVGKASRSSAVARAAAPVTVGRATWCPGVEPPAYLNGTLAGDFGFDPLGLGEDSKALSWYVQAELQNGRWAMLGVAGILGMELATNVGIISGGADWTTAGATAVPSYTNFGTLVVIELIAFGWVETKRYMDYLNPKSQGTEGYGMAAFFQGSGEPGYPGGPLFDPLGFAKGNAAELRLKEIKNGRLAMMAFLGFLGQHYSLGGGPLDNLAAHLADPLHVTVAVNHVALPFLG